MRNYLFLLLFLNCLAYTLQAQNRIIDSLRVQLRQVDNNLQKVDLLNELGYAYLYISTDSTLAMAGQAEKLAEQLNYTKGIINAQIRRGNVFQIRAELIKTLTSYQSALKLAEQINDTVSIARITGNMGLLYSAMQNFYQALHYYKQALAMQERIGNLERIATNKANMGNTYVRLGDYQSAEKYLTQGYQDAVKCNAITAQMVCMRNFAELYEILGKDQQVEEVLEKAFVLLKELGNLRDKSICLVIKARLRLRQKQFKEAQVLAEEAIGIALKNTLREQLRVAYDILHQIYAAENNFEKAYYFQKLTNAYRDSVVNSTNLSFANAFEYEKKQNEIALLNKQRALEKAENDRQRLINYALFAFAILLGIMAFNFFKQQRREKQSKQVLAEKNEEISQILAQVNIQKADIERKNEDITASITYAKRIQTAILPLPEKFVNAFAESNYFIFFQPRDIVSGDFYFLEHIGNQLFLAAADCTGHGVPGAFMSMISTQLLHDIIIQKQIHEPAQILTTLHYEIRRALQQEASNTTDGLDIALLRIDLAEKRMDFAGAKNSLFYFEVEQQDAQLQEIRGNRWGIGDKHLKEVSFDQHTVSLTTPKMLYLFSDGFQDQFGGADNRKFSSKNFKNLLAQIHKLSLTHQKENIAQALQSWKGSYKQIDDILVLGVRV